MNPEFIYRRSDGSDSEVMAAEELTRVAMHGLITEETLVANPGWGNWTPAWKVPFLQHAFGLSLVEPVPLPVEEEPVAVRKKIVIGPKPAEPEPEPEPEPLPEPVAWDGFLLST